MTTSISSGEYKRWEGEEGRKEGRKKSRRDMFEEKE